MKAGTLRLPIEDTIDEALAAANAADPWIRSGISAGMLGHECDRFIWYQLRHAFEREIDGPTQRTFDLGHAVEKLVIDWLRQAGYEVVAENPRSSRNQYSAYILGGALGGYLDAFVRGNGLGDRWHTVSVKRKQSAKYHRREDGTPKAVREDKEGQWWRVAKRGVINEDVMAYIQEQTYLGCLREKHEEKDGTVWENLEFVAAGEPPPDRCLYLCLNTDTLALYAEVFAYDPSTFVKYAQRAVQIYGKPTPPDRIREIPKWWPCEWCDAVNVCHGTQPMVRTCRTCVHAEAKLPGKSHVRRYQWLCSAKSIKLDRARDKERAEQCNLYRPIMNEEMF